MKILLTVLVILFILIVGTIIWVVTSEPDDQNKSTKDQTTQEETTENNQIEIQLTDVEEKISALPELEEDIFTKCMEKTKGGPQDIKKCEESTQKQIFTLSQDLANLKEELKKKLEVK